MEQYPRLRRIEAFPIDTEGGRQICIRDPQRLTEQTIFVNDFTFFIISSLDGTKKTTDVRADFERRTGEKIPIEQIEGIVDQLDKFYLLDNDRFRAQLEMARREYEDLSARPASHAGLSYPDDPAELKKLLDGYYEDLDASAPDQARGPIRGVIAPHIDIKRGGPCFAEAYNKLRGRTPDVFVVFGIAHALSRNLFTIETRDFQTPLGVVPIDHAGAARLSERLGDSIFEENFTHRSEHSIEFQAVFLRHLFGDKEPPPILPILCSSFHHLLGSGKEPSEDSDVGEFLDALEYAVGDRDACYVAGVDLAHVGVKFGDPEAPDEAARREIRRRDLDTLKTVEAVDAAGFFKSIAVDEDARRVCGFPAIYAFLKSVGAKKGTLLKYDQMNDPLSGSLVSFTSVAFT